MKSANQAHWNQVFQTKPLDSVSWYEPVPTLSLRYIAEQHLPRQAQIIDVGGGDSLLVDHLLALGYINLTVLDISAQAIRRAQKRLGKQASRVHWIISDITSFESETRFDFWHDRAAFHFLTEEQQIGQYLSIASRSLHTGGILSVGTFSDKGPRHCSGLPVRQYTPDVLTALFHQAFAKLYCEEVEHQTPWMTSQAFTFCQFRRM
ncbi:class I SAM-dependent methyltransferase [Spirosoma endophyticum]|uniref:Methyltransferase domain-containing protein n=1 Tax=Spirosoma endophyticum TaxID=662367 RepID=A0A1I2FDX6_9BACT|nr:class I SAM-dependent methyltransferase [Spirosoma endophyticum]SFF02947.1 Methyltransferase domain-containing protein [Spirosoma endophyticum]